MIELNELIITISIALTIPFLCYCSEIMYVWWPSVKETLKTSNGISDAAGRLSRGIWIGFAANFLDNLYWMITWFLVLVQHPIGLVMMLGGALANIFFRQIGGIMAAREHVIAAAKIHEKATLIAMHKYYWLAGLATFVGVIVFRYLF